MEGNSNYRLGRNLRCCERCINLFISYSDFYNNIRLVCIVPCILFALLFGTKMETERTLRNNVKLKLEVVKMSIRLLIRLNGRISIDPQHIVFGLGIVLLGFVILQCVKTASARVLQIEF